MAREVALYFRDEFRSSREPHHRRAPGLPVGIDWLVGPRQGEENEYDVRAAIAFAAASAQEDLPLPGVPDNL